MPSNFVRHANIRNEKVMYKKVIFVAVAIALLAVGCGKKSNQNQNNNNTQTPGGEVTEQGFPLSNLTTDETGPFANWRPYGSPVGQYSIKLPDTWFIDPSSLDGSAGRQIYFGNNDKLDVSVKGAVVVELISGNTKQTSEDLTTIAKKFIKKGASGGKIENAITTSGLQIVRVENLTGAKVAVPGYFVELSPTSFLTLFPSSNNEDEMVRNIVSTIDLLKN